MDTALRLGVHFILLAEFCLNLQNTCNLRMVRTLEVSQEELREAA